MKQIILLFGLTTAAWAQIGTSTMTGRVTDASGAIVPNCNVTVVQKATNFTSNTKTNEEGLYRVLSLQPGTYKVTFEAAGFKKTVRDDIELRTGDTLAVDSAMQVGQTTEQIEVTGGAQALETETSATGTVMSGNVLYEMPLYQRYVNSTLNLVPGMTSGGYAYGGDLGSYHLAGQRNGAIGIFEDGVNGNDQLGGTGTIKPLQNAVAEVKVITTVPPAEYGHSGGGVISVVKKSGTNELHGMGSWYGRTRRMQHRLFFDKFTTSQLGVMTFFMQPDANIGGPVMIPKLYDGRNKTFFFFGYQRLHEKKVAQVVDTVPTLDMRAGNFNFPGVANSNLIFDPASTRRNPDGTWSRDPFPGNRVPTGRFDPVANKVLGFDPWVQPNFAGGTFNSLGPSGNLLANELALTFFNDYNLRIDHQFSSAFKIYGSYTDNAQTGFQRPITIRTDRAAFDHQQGNYNPFRGLNASLGYTWVASSSLVNDSRIGYLRRRSDLSVPSFGGNWPQQLGIPNLDPALMPAFGSGSRSTPEGMYGITGATPFKQVGETFSYRNDTTLVRGTHAFKFGYELLHYTFNSANFARPASLNFGGVTAGLQPNGVAVPNTGNYFAGFLTGYVAQGLFTQELTSWLPKASIHSFYFQDDWKLTRTLTLNLGVRYSNESPFTTKNGAMSNFDPKATDPLTGRLGAIIHPTSGLNRRDNNNFNPRFGAAWHPLQKWVFRGGIGMYTIDVKFPQQRGNYDEYVATANQQAAPGDPTPVFRLSQGPAPARFAVNSNGTSTFVGSNFGSRSVEYWDPNLRNPYVINFNGGVQYEFTKDYVLDVSYQGSSGVGLVERWQLNTFPVDYFAGNLAQQNTVLASAQNFRPFSAFGDIRQRSNFGHSSFHSGTVKLEKRMSRGIFFSTFYTWSKAINSQDNDNDGTGVAPIQNRRLEKALAGYHRGHRWLATVNYELPFGGGKKYFASGWKKHVFGGLELSWIQTVESGNPLTFSFAGSPNNYYPGFAGNFRPNVVGNPSIRDNFRDLGGDRFALQNINSVFSGGNNGLDNFAYPAPFTVGNSGRNSVIGLPLLWAQVSAQKNFQITEKVRAQLRWDFQNALKTYNFNPPTTTFDTRNPRTFGKVSSDPRTASLGGQPLMNLTLAIFF
ncbi:MAG: TonB-dependent receptor [Bryobacteraceae bacterium]|nr:TonB-dependent receptor [Bryobacteraceae bacterium]